MSMNTLVIIRDMTFPFLTSQPARIAFAALACVSLTFAQTEPVTSEPYNSDDEAIAVLEAFEVTGSFAGSLAAAAEAKKIAPLVVETLVAEDIGKLPDTSIAESLSRLPGLTSQRVNGRSQVISIRGFPAEFSTGLLNGRVQATTSGNRNIEYDQYPAELLAGAIVYKTTDAALIGQGLSGTVDMLTIRPLDHGKRTLAFNGFYEWTELGKLNAGSDDAGYRFSGTYIDQFDDNTQGLAIGYSYTDKPGQGEQWNAWGYPTATNPDTGESASILGGAKPFVRSSQLERNSLMAVWEAEFTENVTSTVDVFYSDFNETQMLRGIEIPLWWSSAQFRMGSEAVDNGVVTEGTFDNVFGVVRNDVVFRDAEILSLGWNLDFKINENWSVEADFSYSEVTREDTVLETYSGTGSNQTGTPDSITYSLEGGTGAVFTPVIDYSNPGNLVLAGPQGWGGDIVPGGQVGFLKTPTTNDDVTQIQLKAARKMTGFLDRFEFGYSYIDRSKGEAELGEFLALQNGAVEAPLPTVIGETNLAFIGIGGMASYDPLAALNSGSVYDRIPNPNADAVSVDWEVSEEIHTPYLKFDIFHTIGDIQLTGNFGLQFVYTDQASTGLAASGTGDNVVALPVNDSHDYEDWVPSLNLNFMLTANDYIRLFAGRQIMRQRMQDLRAGFQWNYDPAKANSTDPLDGPWTGGGGNTQLEPWRANALDVSYEHYFADGMGYVSIAGFFKDLRTFAFNQRQITDFTGFPFTGTTPPAIFEGYLDVPQNASGGEIMGLEFALSLPGELLTDVLSGFGLIFNYAYTDNQVQPDPNNPSTPLPGFSENAGSATVYYEKHGFGARVSGRYRSDYRANIATFGPRGEDFRTVQAETLIDAQLSYTFNQGPMEGLTLILQGYNLNDEPLATFEGEDQRLVRDYQNYGRSYSLGASYKF